jgi:SAM-dependent methyltransferase
MARPRGVAALAAALVLVALFVSFAGMGAAWRGSPQGLAIQPVEKGPNEPDVEFIPTPPAVVETMLGLADVQRGELVYDLGCGDGRILFAAAKEHGARGVGIEIDEQLVAQCRAQAAAGGLADELTFSQADLFATDFSDADVVTLYLLPHLNVQLVPQLQQLRPGTRIVSHAFGIDGYPADKLVMVPDKNGGEAHKVYFWETPLEPGEGFVKR